MAPCSVVAQPSKSYTFPSGALHPTASAYPAHTDPTPPTTQGVASWLSLQSLKVQQVGGCGGEDTVRCGLLGEAYEEEALLNCSAWGHGGC